MAVGIISGSGMYSLPGFEDSQSTPVATPYGEVTVSTGTYAGQALAHIARHGAGHALLSNGVNHRANIWALKQIGATCVIGLTACGAVDPDLELGSLLVFDDLHFISNRLPDGSLCTYFSAPAQPGRGHWVLHGSPFSEGLRAALGEAALATGQPFQVGGIYGHVDGPRFNTPAEIAQLAAAGVAAVSQTGGPETVLCGELELPFALVGYVTDYANGVYPGEPTPVSLLTELIARAPDAFAQLLAQALGRIAALPEPPAPAGTMFRFA
ncbi:MAG TPA: MTAP family purine nucleoside phosphorylase [Solirubrobacteraceae bacterium]|nr:MTAP family purine nucleoside phosphorylase [Solirubrobacteraceae bacterium]